MNTVKKKQAILAFAALAILVTIPLTVFQLSQEQNGNGHAAAGSSLAFTPTSTSSTPIQTSVGKPVDLDINVDPGSSLVTFVRFQVTYDPTKVQIVAGNPITLNSTVFTNVEGPVISNNGTVAESVSIGSDPTKAISKVTKIGTLHFTAVGGTNGSTTTISYGTISEALSGSANNQASQNVLSTTTPAYIAITGNGSPTISPAPTALPIPTITGTALNFSLLLHGVGAAGDNPNPTGNSLSNKNPLHPQRVLKVEVFDTSNTSVANSSSPVTYDNTSGMFIGAVGLPSSVKTGNYSVKIQTDRYLRKLVPGIQHIVSGQVVSVTPPVEMIAGDTNNDNVLNVLDYNALLDCGYGDLNPLPMNDPNATFHKANCQVHTPAEDLDLNDDGIINSTDYNLFLRELSVQNGD